MITDQDQAAPSDPKDDVDKAMMPSRRLPRSRPREDEGICVANPPRRSERSDTMALTEQQAIMIDVLQPQSQRLITLGNLVRQGTDRQSRLEQTASTIVGSIQTVLTKSDPTQRQQGRALMQHEPTIANHPHAQDPMQSLTGETAVQQEMTHGRQLSAEEELARAQQLLQQALRQQQSTQQVMMIRQLAHGRGTLSLRKSILQQALVKDEPMSPLEPPPMMSPGGNGQDQTPALEPKLLPFTNATPPCGIPGLKFPDHMRDRPVSDSSRTTAPWGENGQSLGHFHGDLFRPMPPPVPPRPNFDHCARCVPGTQPESFPSTVPPNPMSWSAAPPVVDACPPCTPSAYQHWKREVRLWLESFLTAATSKLLDKIISVFPRPSKLDGLSYMDQTGNAVETRSIQALATFPDARYGKTDSERALSWLNQFTAFVRTKNENLED